MLKKRKKAIAFLAAGLILLFAAACTSASPASAPADSAPAAETPSAAPPAQSAELLVMAAASLTDVMNEIADGYMAENPGVKITFTFASSGALQTQIEEGAPADIFMSAAAKQMDALSSKDLILEETRKDLLINEVVLIAPKDSDKGISAFGDVLSAKVGKIALGEPQSVPAGQYAEEVFTYLSGLDEARAKAVYGSDVRQVLTWVETGEADCGVVYATDAASSDDVTVVAIAPAESHKPVTYPVAVLKDSSEADAAAAFLDYLSMETQGAVFEKYGFTLSK